ncbi:hypothetical protein DFJ77DRAFT_445530 [Powellomyces hirtus]|nr:hypothetical protein DFJ77DRAFT_445530 [Powellomyces hirtus]
MFRNLTFSVFAYPLLLLSFILLVTVPSVHSIQHDSRSNYGNYHKAAQYAREHSPPAPPLTDIPAFKNADEEDLYYFFSLHDVNKDHHLDGHELRNAFTHAGELPPKDQRLKMADVEDMIDHALLEDDIDSDGLISWEEYLASQLYHDDYAA